MQNSEVMAAYEHAFADDEVQHWLDNQLRRHRQDGFGLWAVYSIIRDTNLPSQAAAKRNGMCPCGSFVKQYHGHVMPHIVFGITRQRWRQAAPAAPESR